MSGHGEILGTSPGGPQDVTMGAKRVNRRDTAIGSRQTRGTADPLWLVFVAYALGALACGLFGFVVIKGVALSLLDALRVIAP